MPRNKRVFPFFLDGGIQEVTTASDSWDGTSSFIEVTRSGATSLSIGITDTYGRPIPHGTMLVVKKVSSTYDPLTINPSADFSSRDATTELRGGESMAVFLFKGPSTSNDKGEWVEISKVTDENSKTLQTVTVAGTLKTDGRLVKTPPSVIAAAGTDETDAAAIGTVNSGVILLSSDAATKGVQFNNEPQDNTFVTLINTSATAMLIYPDLTNRTKINGTAVTDETDAPTIAANEVVTVFFPASPADNIIMAAAPKL